MALAGISAIALMLILAKRELDHVSDEELEAEIHSDSIVDGRHSRGMSFSEFLGLQEMHIRGR